MLCYYCKLLKIFKQVNIQSICDSLHTFNNVYILSHSVFVCAQGHSRLYSKSHWFILIKVFGKPNIH